MALDYFGFDSQRPKRATVGELTAPEHRLLLQVHFHRQETGAPAVKFSHAREHWSGQLALDAIIEATSLGVLRSYDNPEEEKKKLFERGSNFGMDLPPPLALVRDVFNEECRLWKPGPDGKQLFRYVCRRSNRRHKNADWSGGAITWAVLAELCHAGLLRTFEQKGWLFKHVDMMLADQGDQIVRAVLEAGKQVGEGSFDSWCRHDPERAQRFIVDHGALVLLMPGVLNAIGSGLLDLGDVGSTDRVDEFKHRLTISHLAESISGLSFDSFDSFVDSVVGDFGGDGGGDGGGGDGGG